MGSANPAMEPVYLETGLEPEFFFTHSRTEDAGNGNVRVFCYVEKRKGQFVLLYTAVIPAVRLATIARRGMSASTMTFAEMDSPAH